MPYNTTKVQALKSYPTYQFYAKADSKVVDTNSIFKICILESLKWIRSRLRDHKEIPQDLIAPEPEKFEEYSLENITTFSHNMGYQIDVIYIDTLGIWSFRITEPDMGANLGTPLERLAVNGRTFTTEIAFRMQSKYVEVGIRTICSEPSNNDTDCEVFRPRIVKALAENKNLSLTHGGLILDEKPLEVKNKSNLERFCEMFFDSTRSMPIIIIADSKTEIKKASTVDCISPDYIPTINSYSLSRVKKQSNTIKITISADVKDYKTNILHDIKPQKAKTKSKASKSDNKPEQIKLPTLDYNKLAKALVGFAIVVFTDEKFFSQIENKTHISISYGDINIFTKKQFSERYVYSNYKNDIESFFETIRTTVIDMSKRSQYSFGDILFYSDAKLKEFHTKRVQTDSLEEKCNLFKSENEELKSQVRELSQQQYDMQQNVELLRIANKRIETLTKDFEAEKKKNTELADEAKRKEKAYCRSSHIIDFYRKQIDIVAEFPKDKKGICEWIKLNFSKELIVAQRAESEMRKYNGALDIISLCDGIVFLDAYAKYRRQELLEDDLIMYSERRNWEVQGCGSASINMFRSDYTVTYNENQYLLNQHIKHGIQAEELIRIYFCWDDKTQKIIIGSMPEHLPTVKNST